MEITIKVNIIPFDVPSHVQQVMVMPTVPRQTGLVVSPRATISLEELDPSVLNELCNQFRAGVFSNTNKKDIYSEGNR